MQICVSSILQISEVSLNTYIMSKKGLKAWLWSITIPIHTFLDFTWLTRLKCRYTLFYLLDQEKRNDHATKRSERTPTQRPLQGHDHAR